MNTEQIAAVRAALAAIESAIAQTEAALRMAATPDDVLALTSTLIDLRAERVRLQLQLTNLEAAAIVVQPLAREALESVGGTPAAARRGPATRAREMRSLEKQLKTAVTDRTVVAATLTFATDVMRMAKTVRMIGDDTAPPKAARTRKKASK